MSQFKFFTMAVAALVSLSIGAVSLLTANEPLLPAVLAVTAVVIPLLASHWAFKEAKHRQGREGGPINFFSDINYLSRTGWVLIVASIPLGVSLIAVAVNL
ncbi:MAG: hypothetical protein EOP50_15265 [Sphingobacteriales bacterium]|nr:MAG: hypothetical protein EOP50_15265 [Sphingobacteriales bacterium]